MRTSSLRSAALVLPFLALAACDGPILFAELEIPSVELTLPQQTFAGTTFPAESNSTEFSFDIGANVPSINEPNVEYDLRLTRMTLVLDLANPATPDNFDGVDSIDIDAFDPGGVLADLRLLHYAKTTTGLTRITVNSQTDADLKPYLVAGSINVRVTYAGTALPTVDWTADLTAEFYMRVKLDYGAYL